MSPNIPDFKTSKVDIGFSPKNAETKKLYKEVEAFARHGHPVLILGPTGSGKEFLARHYYKTLAGTDFYRNNKKAWSKNYKELLEFYDPYYSDDEMKVFKNSIRAGIYRSINSAMIYPDLVESILFGHEANSFTDAKTKPGLMETIKFGVLFLDEIGELSNDIQGKLLRAVDSEIREGTRISGKLDYSLKDLIVISATNQPKDKIRPDLYYKLGVKVEMKGIDERREDIQVAIPYFISKAFDKRKDYQDILDFFGINELDEDNAISESEDVLAYSKREGDAILEMILSRKWPGNFRALRIALEASILRIESLKNETAVSEEFQKHLQYYLAEYSEEAAGTSSALINPYTNSIFPSANPTLDIRILSELNNEKKYAHFDETEMALLAAFLGLTYESTFSLTELEKQFKSHPGIRYSSKSHLRNLINRLMTENLISSIGRGRGTRYFLSRQFLDKMESEEIEIFSLPEIKSKWTGRETDIIELDKWLQNSKRIFIQAPAGYGKSAFITMFCHTRENHYNFYYYPKGKSGIKKLFEDFSSELKARKIVPQSEDLLTDPVNQIHPWLGKLLKPKGQVNPVLILDDIDYISDPDDRDMILRLVNKWNEVTLILIGAKMDNELHPPFTEFPLLSWKKDS